MHPRHLMPLAVLLTACVFTPEPAKNADGGAISPDAGMTGGAGGGAGGAGGAGGGIAFDAGISLDAALDGSVSDAGAAPDAGPCDGGLCPDWRS